MNFEFVVTVEMPDETRKQFLTNEPYRIGEYKNGGKVVSCNGLSKIID